jgi:hypothetical protein
MPTILSATSWSTRRSIDTDLKYPMVDLFTDAMMPLMYLSILTAWYLLLLTAPVAFDASMDERT